jgi:hypothetical protein
MAKKTTAPKPAVSDIKPGTIGIVSVLRSNRMWLCNGIKLSSGSIWNHVFLVVSIHGKLYAFEEGTIWGVVFTPLDDYLAAEKRGDCVLAFKNLKNWKPEQDNVDIVEYCFSLVGERPYGVFEIPKQFIKQNLQKIGIYIDWRTKSLICSYLVRNILNKFYGVFAEDKTPAPDDIHNDTLYTLFIQH